MKTTLFSDMLGASSIALKLDSSIVETISNAPVSTGPFKTDNSSALKAAFIKNKLKTQNFYKKPEKHSVKKSDNYKPLEVPQSDIQKKLEAVNNSTLAVLNNLKGDSKQSSKPKRTVNRKKTDETLNSLERASYKKSKYMKRTGRMLNKISAAEKLKYKEISMLNNKKRKEKVKLKEFIKNKENEDIVKSGEINKDNIDDIFEDNLVETNILKNNASKKDFSLFSIDKTNTETDLISKYNKELIDESESEEEKEEKRVHVKPSGWGNWYSVDEERKEYIDKKNKSKNVIQKENKEEHILFLNTKNKQSKKYTPGKL
eukprot:GAHX01002055.1.p1 GENE.GAHX01002055.1~~GAHX01002055.1.p1  ORF type:complete len:316 (+),score=92.77 GAHX01002055.1:30-977(+)